MGRRRLVLTVVTAASLVAACSSGGSDDSANGASALASSVADATTSTVEVTATTAAPSTTTTTVAPATTTTAAPPATPTPTAASSPPSVATGPETRGRQNCAGTPDPPAGALGLQATFLDVDADNREDVVWLYDAPDGTHLHLRTGKGVTDDFVLGYGKGAVAVGSAQVDLAVGSQTPGMPQEILAVTSAGDGKRLVGIYGFMIKTGCIEPFVFSQGAPFVYLVSRTGTLSGLSCVNDGVTGHVEGTVATPAANGFDTTRLVYERVGRRLVPAASESGTIAANDAAGLAARQRRHGLHALTPGLLSRAERRSVPLEQRDGAQAALQVVLHGPRGQHRHLVVGL